MITNFLTFIKEGRITIIDYREPNRKTIVKYNPDKKGIKKNNFDIFNKSNSLNYKTLKLKKTKLTCFKLYDLTNKLFKYLKYTDNLKDNNVEIDKDSFLELKEESYWYASELIDEKMPLVDYIVSPESSSKFNSDFLKGIKKNLKKNVIIMDDFFTKYIDNIKYDKEYGDYLLKNGLITEDDIITIKNKIKKWKTIDEPIRLLTKLKEELYDEVNNIPIIKSDDRVKIYSRITKIQSEILDLKTNGRSSALEKDKIKNWSIKNVPGIYRQLLSNVFKINTKYDNLIETLSNKKIVVFDDIVTTGKTLDEVCSILLDYGVKKENILIISYGSIDINTHKK